MTRYVFTGSDDVDHAQFYPPRANDEYVGNFFGGRDEVQLVQGLMTIDMGNDNDNVRGYCSGGVIFMGDGDDNAAVGIGAALTELSVYGQAGDDILGSFGFGERGDVRLYGGDGADKFEPDVKAERLDGGDGFDFISPISSISTGNLVTSDTIVSIEGQDGSAAADLINSWGTNATAVSGLFTQVGMIGVTNALQGFKGADTLQGSDQSDILIGNGYRFLQESLSNFRGMGGIAINRESLTEDDAANDDLRGGGGNDYLDGGDGADQINGGTGNDTASYASFQASQSSGVSVNLATGANSDGDTLISIENLVGSEFRGYSGTGNDTLSGNRNVNILVGCSGNDVLNGQGGRDTLYGNSDNDTLIDLDGSDRLYGGTGNDIYRLGKAATIVELAGEGYDVVESAASLTLSANLEDLTLTGSAAIRATGNDAANVLTGNDAANRLDGQGGEDRLVGGKGDDTYVVDTAGDTVIEEEGSPYGIDTVITSITYRLGANLENLTLTGNANIDGTGNSFANVLIGNAGNNILNGGAGDDTYRVDNASDGIIEVADQGRDTVIATVGYRLGQGQEIEVLQTADAAGTAALQLVGNEFANTIIGNAGANILSGGAGIDELRGGAGGDTYIIDNKNDRVIEAVTGGTDTVTARVSYALGSGQEIERLRATSGNAKIDLTGNTFNQSLVGNTGANVLNGKLGSDLLTGGGGSDTFVFSTTLGTTNVDRITDFAVEDTILLSGSVFTALTRGQLQAKAFKDIGKGNAIDADDRILYDSANGSLFYDADGSGNTEAVKFAVIDNLAAMTNADFLIS